MKALTPCLWFDGQAEEAANFYVSVFKNGRIGAVSRYSEEAAKATGRPAGSAMVVTFTLNGQDFMALNGGPQYKFTPAVSFVINCENQEEIDHFWDKLSEGGELSRCGWLQDKFGVSWQVVPAALDELMSGDSVRSARVMGALLRMQKLDIATLQRAYDG